MKPRKGSICLQKELGKAWTAMTVRSTNAKRQIFNQKQKQKFDQKFQKTLPELIRAFTAATNSSCPSSKPTKKIVPKVIRSHEHVVEDLEIQKILLSIKNPRRFLS